MTKVSLVFPDNSDKLVFESATWPTKDPAKATKLAGQKVEYSIESNSKTDKLFVVDTTSGKVAVKPIGDIKDGTWTVSKEEFNAVYKVRVEVSTPKGPINAASVELQDAADKRTELIDPSSNGAGTFFFVKPGDVKVAVSYKAGGQTKDPVRQTFTVGGDKDATLKIALPDGEAIVAPTTTTASSNEPAKTAKEKDIKSDEKVVDPGSPIGNFLTTLIGLAFVGGVGYFIVQYMKKNPDQVKNTLTKLGADIPQPGDANNAVHDPNPVAPIAPQPMQQIILGGAPPSTIPAAASPIQQISQAVVSGIPKLIASDGSAFELPEGETTVGREFGVGLVVPNDTVSRNHASLIKSGGSVELKDHSSTNGCWINGAKVTGSQQLRPGDSVRFGSIEYRFEG